MDSLKNKTDILNNKSVFKRSEKTPSPKIYFLIKENNIVYVGKSLFIEDRLEFHYQNKKDFTHYSVVECSSPQEMDILESIYIQILNPKYNKSKGKTSVSKEYLLNSFKRILLK